MHRAPANPWLAEQVDQALVERLTERHVPNRRGVEMSVDLLGDPHREDDDGLRRAWGRNSR
jgi:hypothetical protein